MSWQRLQRIVEAQDIDGLIDWAQENKTLIDRQVLVERVQTIFGNSPVRIEPGDSGPYHDDYVDKITVGEDWTCSPKFYALLTSRKWARDIFIRNETIEESISGRWEQNEFFKVTDVLLVYYVDPEHGAKVTLEASLYKDRISLGSVTLPDVIPFPPRDTFKQLKDQAKAVVKANLESLFEEAKRRFESGDFEDD